MSATVIINNASIRQKINSSPSVFSKFKKVARSKLEPALKESEDNLKSSFERHGASVEIAGGPTASSSYAGIKKGNLFSLLGFYAFETPVEEIVDMITDSIKIKSIRKTNKELSLSIYIDVPKIEDFRSQTELPWITGKGWTEVLEDGITNVANYFFSSNGFSGVGSRSGHAFQVSRELPSEDVVVKNYLPTMLKELKKEIKRLARESVK